MVLEKGCFVIELRNACLVIGYGELIYMVLTAATLVHFVFSEDINLTDIVWICVKIFVCVLLLLSSIILLYGTYKDEPKCFAVWFGFAGCIAVTLFIISIFSALYEFYCLYIFIDTIAVGVIVYCIFVAYSYYKEL